MLKLCNAAQVDYSTLTDRGMPFLKLVVPSLALNALTMNLPRHWKSLCKQKRSHSNTSPPGPTVAMLPNGPFGLYLHT